MILVCDGVVNADDLELAEPEMILNESSSIATYGMQDQYDSSGNGYDLVTGNEFTELGMRTVAESAHGANTGIIESDEMTFALCINMNQPTVSAVCSPTYFPVSPRLVVCSCELKPRARSFYRWLRGIVLSQLFR
ncbi:TPA: hypothetical protein ACW7QF_003278 [Klebsiella aerogenes]